MNIDSLEQTENLSEVEIHKRLDRTREILQEVAAHYVIDTFDQLPHVVENINLRLDQGKLRSWIRVNFHVEIYGRNFLLGAEYPALACRPRGRGG